MEKRDMEILLKSQQGELDAVLMYEALAKVVKDRRDSDTFKQLASEEGHHASVFRNLTKQTLKPKKDKSHLFANFIQGHWEKAFISAYSQR